MQRVPQGVVLRCRLPAPPLAAAQGGVQSSDAAGSRPELPGLTWRGVLGGQCGMDASGWVRGGGRKGPVDQREKARVLQLIACIRRELGDVIDAVYVCDGEDALVHEMGPTGASAAINLNDTLYSTLQLSACNGQGAHSSVLLAPTAQCVLRCRGSSHC